MEWKISEAIDSLISILDYNDSLPATANDQARVVPYLVSGAGVGKSSAVKQACERTGRGLEPLHLATFNPTQVGGDKIPNKDGTETNQTKPIFIKNIERKIAEGQTKGVLFLDELAQAITATLNVARPLILERRIGDWELPEGWQVVCAGNRLSDKAGVNALPSHVKDVLTYIPIAPDLEDTLSYFAKIGLDFKVSAYLRARPNFYYLNDPTQDVVYTPRAWEKAGHILKIKGLNKVTMMKLLAGTIGESATNDFIGFLKLIGSVPEFLDLDKLINNPDTATIPEKVDVLYALCGAISTKANEKNFDNIVKYISRFKEINKDEMAVVVIKDAIRRNPELLKNKAYKEWVRNSGRELIV